jgi:hypothetical protein
VKIREKRISDTKEFHLPSSRGQANWLQATERAGACLADAGTIALVVGREGGIYQLFANRPVAISDGGLLANRSGYARRPAMTMEGKPGAPREPASSRTGRGS